VAARNGLSQLTLIVTAALTLTSKYPSPKGLLKRQEVQTRQSAYYRVSTIATDTVNARMRKQFSMLFFGLFFVLPLVGGFSFFSSSFFFLCRWVFS